MNAQLSDRDLLARLVAFESVSRAPNRPIADFVCQYVDRPGVVITRDEDDSGDKVNVIARVGPQTHDVDGGLVLSGHLDVVPADEADWRSDPFRLHVDDDRAFGRGACDMKGFVAVALNVVADLAAAGLARPLVLVLTCDEELGSLGAQQLVAGPALGGRLPRSVVVGEPTGLRVVRMHKGHLKLRITLEGRRAHSGTPHLGRNAIERVEPVLAALRTLRDELALERAPTSDFFPDVPCPVLNIGRIEGGEAINVVPDRCVLDVGIRQLPGGADPARVERLTERVRSAAGGDAVSVEVINDSPPMLTDVDAPVHETLCALVTQTGSHGVSFSSDAGVLRRDLGLDCVLFGPGSMDVAHRANEYVPLPELAEADRVLRTLVRSRCSAEPVS